MGIKLYRITYKLGASRAITLPSAWCEYYGKRVDKVTILGSSLLIIAPRGLEDEAQKVAEEMGKMK